MNEDLGLLKDITLDTIKQAKLVDKDKPSSELSNPGNYPTLAPNPIERV